MPRAIFPTNRLEAFSDGVLAIIITIMVLELKVPSATAHPPAFADLKPVLPTLFSYALSFVYIAIYWNNHHHLLHATRKVTAGILWANLHLLFWLSLIPFVTAWMGQNHFASAPTALYGLLLLLAALAYILLQAAILRVHGPDSPLAQAIGNDFKGKLSLALYAAAIALSFLRPWLAHAIYVVAALLWLIPDRRIERALIGRTVTEEQPPASRAS